MAFLGSLSVRCTRPMAKCLPLSHTPIIGCFRPTSPTVMQLFLGPYLSTWHWVLEKATVPWVFRSFHPKWPVCSETRLASLSGAARSLEPSFLSGVWNESCSLSQSRRLIIPSIQIWIHTNSKISRALFLFSSFFFFLRAAIGIIITFQLKKVDGPFFSFFSSSH